MPKIIENLPERLKTETRAQLTAAGYSAVTVRSVAAGCGVGVGTVYNYYPSKDALVAACLLEDWERCLDAIRAGSAAAPTGSDAALCVCRQLRLFLDDHASVFRDQGAETRFAGAFARYHARLRSQLAEPLRRFCGGDFAAEFIAEALLTWTTAGREPEEILSAAGRLFDA